VSDVRMNGRVGRVGVGVGVVECGLYRALGPELIPVYRQSARMGDFKPSTRQYRLPLFSARPAVTFPTEERHRPSAGTKLYSLVTEVHAGEQLALGY